MTDKHAVISDCGTYRYQLTRRWGPGHLLVFVMLNPSTADADVDDPTIRKCKGFAIRLGYAGIVVVNLCAYRATSPENLRKAGFLVGPHNHQWVAATLQLGDGRVCCAWGAHVRGTLLETLAQEMIRDIRMRGHAPMALAVTDDGIPRHPLMLSYEQNGQTRQLFQLEHT